MDFKLLILLLLPCAAVAYYDPMLDAIAYRLTLVSEDLQSENNYFRMSVPTDRQAANAFSTNNPEVNTTSGLVVGSTLPESHAFYSIPYGEAPIGDMRYKPPIPVTYRGLLNTSVPNYVRCFEFPANCTSDDDCTRNYSEDCLVLNVNVPSSVDLKSPFTQLLPVMFWIHGGAFFFGAGTDSMYDARWLSNSTNTLIVSVNYRLSALGYLVYEENGETIDGNQGIKDQQLALKWVQDNIEKFGGDKNRVTIFGNSAGAQSAMLHLMSDKSKPYFIRAIMQSNPASYYYPTKAEAMLKTEALLEALNCTGSGLQCLKEASASSIMNAQGRVMASGVVNFYNIIEPYRPVLDDDEFKEQPLEFFQSGKWQNDKEVIIGTTTEEVAVLNAILQNFTINKALFYILSSSIVGPTFGTTVADEYAKLAGPNPGRNYDYTDILGQEISDMIFVCPSRILARFMSDTSNSQEPPVYLYADDHPVDGPNCEETSPFCGYAFHGSETYFLFNAGPNTGMIFGENDTLVANMFSDFWGHFAYNGKPTPDLTAWPNYVSGVLEGGAIESWTNVRIQAPVSIIEHGYRQDLCDFWDSLNFYVNITQPSDVTPVSTATTVNEKSTITHATDATSKPLGTSIKPTVDDVVDTTTDGTSSITSSYCQSMILVSLLLSLTSLL